MASLPLTRPRAVLWLLAVLLAASPREARAAGAQEPAAQEPAVQPQEGQDPGAKPAGQEPVQPPQEEPPAPAPQEPVPAARPPRDRPTVLAIEVEGERRYTEQQLRDALGQRVGAPIDPTAIEQGLQVLWKAFRVRASVAERQAEGGIVLVLSVVEISVDLEPRFVGNAEIDEETLRRWAQLGERSELWMHQTARVRQRLIEGYEREGFYFVEVQEVVRGEVERTGADDVLPDVIFEIREGPRVRVSDVLIRGNVSMPETGMWFWKGGLAKLARTELEGPGILNWRGDKFVEEVLQADLVAMREVYRDRGWLDAVVEVERLEFSEDRGRVIVHVVVDEGRPWRVSKVSIRGVERDPATSGREWKPAELLFPEPELLSLLELEVGGRYERALQRRDEAKLREHYGGHGYVSHPSLRGLDSFEFLDPELRYDFERHEVEVTYRIAQGRKRWIREVLFDGGEYTRDRVVRREVRALPGDLADQREIDRALRRLFETNYFADDAAPLDHQEPTYRFLPVEGDPDLVDLEFTVEEGRVVNFFIQGGVDTNSGLFGRIQLSMRNFDVSDPPESLWTLFGDIYDKTAFHGAGQRLDLELSPGTEVNAWRVHFLEPDIWRTHFDRTSLDLDLNNRRRSYDFYEEERLTRQFKLGREFGLRTFAAVGYTFQDLEVDDIEAPLSGFVDPNGSTVPIGIFEQEGESQLAGALFDLIWRDTDSRIDPRKGMTVNSRSGLYGGALGGDYQFVRSTLDLDWFWSLGDPEKDVRPGFHIGVGLGLADAFGESSETPYTERFQLGGSRLLRGFDFRGVGPNVGSQPIGGESMVNATVEYRYPLYSVAQPGTYREREVFRLLLFADAGILDPDPWTVDLDELRATLGFGVGMSYPIPLIFNFGFPIASGKGDREQVFSFSIASFWF